MKDAAGNRPLIPAVAGLTTQVLGKLEPTYGKQIAALKTELASHDIETILSRVRALSKVLGSSKVHELDGKGYEKFGEAICSEIGKIVAVNLPASTSAYSEVVNWITGTSRDFPVEIFTTNYDLLFEEAFERTGAPYYDGFTGGREPFFDPVSVASNDLPSRWTRLWKLHGSLGWKAGSNGEVIRTGHNSVTHLVFPEYLKYDQTQKAPYTALLDRLRSFLLTPDTLLVSIGFSFQDSHISARISDALAGNASASVFAFQFQTIENEVAACQLAKRLPNFSVYSPDMAKVNGARGPWVLPSELPTKDWGPIRSTYWGQPDPASAAKFLLGDIEAFARFFAAARSNQAFGTPTTSSASSSTAVVP